MNSFEAFLIFFLTQASCHCKPGFHFVQDEDFYNSKEMIDWINSERLRVISQSKDDLIELTLDDSLNAMARHAMKDCDLNDKAMNGYDKIRFKLYMNLSRTEFYSEMFELRSLENSIYQYLFPDGKNLTENLMNLYFDRTRIGCSFKVCTDTKYKIFNQLCFLGTGAKGYLKKPRCSVLCKEEPISQSSKYLKEDILTLYNTRRQAFAVKVSAGNMYKMNWSESLAANASKLVRNCGKKSNITVPGAIYYEHELLPIAPVEQGKEMGDRYLNSIEMTRKKEAEVYIPYQWNHTKIGCAHAPKPCGKIICIVEIGNMDGPIFEGGTPCSLCEGECKNGLCLAQCAAEVKYSMVTQNPSEGEMAIDLLERLNDPRRFVIYNTNASNLHWLKWDISLAWKASKIVGTCDKQDNPDGFVQIRLRLTNKKVMTKLKWSDHLIVHDLWNDLDEFTNHIKKHGADIDTSIKEFSKFYDFYRSDWTRIGCAFQICKDLLTGEDTNLICLMGPKTDRKGPIFEMKKSKSELCKDCKCNTFMCKEKPFDWNALSDDDFKNKVLHEFNGARSKFALEAHASFMSKLVWDDNLAKSAFDSGSKCPKTATHGPNHREVIAEVFLDRAAGLSTLGEMYGATTVEKPVKELYDWTAMFTILWPKETKVGCARIQNCPNKVVCHFGDIGKLDGEMYAKGDKCSKCTQGCEDGLCI